MYIPQHTNFTTENIENIIAQLDKPVIISGDFNAHSLSYGSTHTDQRGAKMEKLLSNNNELILLNNGTPTHLSSANGTLSAIDLTLTSSSLATKLTWNTHDDLCHSDHFPIIIQFTAQQSNHSYQKYDLKKADWDEFTALTEIKEVTDNNILEAIYNKIQAAVNQTIPKITINNSKEKVPWWTTDIAKLIKSRKKCMRKYKKSKLLADFEEYKKVRSETRKNILEQKTKSWNEFLQKINSSTSATEIWNNINIIKNGMDYQAKHQQFKN